MSNDMRVIYNGDCPVCSHEIGAYALYARDQTLPIRFDDLNVIDLTPLGLSEDTVARRLHVIHNGEVLVGVDGFRALWSLMPRYRWLAWLTGLPVIRPLARFAYDRIVAPVIYARHRRRNPLVSDPDPR